MTTQSVDELLLKIQDLTERLEETEQALRALREGEVDAVVVESGSGQVYTLETADTPYRLLVERMPHAAATLTTDGEIIHCNSRFCDLVQRPLELLPGRPFGGFVALDSQPEMARLLREGRACDVEGDVFLQRADGSSMPAYLGVCAIHEGALGTCLVVSDLTEQRNYVELQRTQAALREVEATLRDADHRKDLFLATLAHELRNPLAPIRNAVQILKAKGPPEPELMWARDVIDRQVRLMARLLEDLLDVSRISRNSMDLRRERIDLADVLTAALETSRPVIDAAQHELTLALPAEPVILEGDPVRLAQAFANLLNNAGKYTENSGRILLTAARRGDDVLVSIKDNGIGIPPETLPRIFEIFAQSNRALGRSQGGLGIGLSLVKGLVELHGGSVEAISAGPGHGSEFIVRLPVCTDTIRVESERPAELAPLPAIKHRILIVDDNEDSADSLAELLKLMGNEVGTAYDGQQALAAAQEQRPEVILLDIGMPELDGYEVCRRIREQPWSAGMQLIALTGWGQDEDRRLTEVAGFDQHMVKPVDPAALLGFLAGLHAEQDSPLGKR